MAERGPVELVEFFLKRRLCIAVDAMTAESSAQSTNTIPNQSSTSAVVSLICHSVNETVPYLATWPKALSLLLDPRNILFSLGVISQLADDYCIAAGVRASRMNWYFDRATMGFLIVATGIISKDDYIIRSRLEINWLVFHCRLLHVS